MKILITGFEPFGGESVNPAYEAVKLLPDMAGDIQIVKMEIPTVFGEAGKVVETGILQHQPDAVICVGQAGRRADIGVERIAINLVEASIPDNAGNQPMDVKVQEDGDTAYFATIPVKAMVKNIKDHGIPASISYTAGTYVCNSVMYDLLYLIDRKYPSIRGGFIHVPYATEQGVGKPVGTATMELSTISKALLYALEAVAGEDKN
ncbi:pyroglutamyl-peptidase I [Coprococcus sp. AF18-48]|nr:pyroglutamyl-peptidase I [Coprococcus sp. AF18-48]